MPRVVRFTHDSSLEVGADGFRVHQSGNPNPEYFRNLPDVDYTCEAVSLDEGLVHLYGRAHVYEIKSDPNVGFVVQAMHHRFA